MTRTGPNGEGGEADGKEGAVMFFPGGPRGSFVSSWLLSITLLLGSCQGLPPRVDTITIVNPTSYALQVEVTGPEKAGRLLLHTVQPESENTAREVIDQGDLWIFRFRHWGDLVGELSVSREDLERMDWRVEIPAEIEERLEEMGRPSSG